MILGVVVFLLVAWAVLFGEGDDPGRLAWIGGAAVVAAAACVALLPRPRPTRAGWAFLGLLAAYAAWVGLSVLWSWAPDRAWDAFNRDVAYLAFAVLGVYAARLGAQRVGAALAIVVGAAGAWALLTRVAPSLDEELERVGRLSEPVGYWNLLAFVLVLGLPLALRLRPEPAAVAVYALALAILLTYSRGGILAGVVAVGAYVVLARPPLTATVATLTAGAAPAAAVFATDADGAAFGVLLVAGAGVAVALVRAVPQRALARFGAAVSAVALVAVVVAVGNPLDDFTNAPTEQRPGTELVTATSNNRWTWWNEAWDAWAAEPVAGTGAGSFELVHRRLRENELYVSDPHSLPLGLLAETGLVGLLLLGGAAAAAVAAAHRAERTPAAAALAAGGIAYLVHALVDLHWQYAAATAPVLVTAGVLVGSSAGVPPTRARRSRLAGVAAAVAAPALLYSLAAPTLADWRVETARERIGDRDHAGAVDAARAARSLDPLAVEPLFALGLAYDLGGAPARALEAYEDAVALQPENWRTWYELGVFEYRSLRALDAAFLDLDKAYALDSRNVIVQRALDEVRDTLNRG